MTYKTFKRSELRDTLDKRDRAATKLGETEAKRYLRENPPVEGNGLIRSTLAAIALLLITWAILVITMAL